MEIKEDENSFDFPLLIKIALSQLIGVIVILLSFYYFNNYRPLTIYSFLEFFIFFIAFSLIRYYTRIITNKMDYKEAINTYKKVIITLAIFLGGWIFSKFLGFQIREDLLLYSSASLALIIQDYILFKKIIEGDKSDIKEHNAS